ncbi:unnamed protein product [Arabis nemorensis]|uniref:Uncharacterized protein n=1 Tax=Arabis nemorensis TaxID=586526 RepID=A0A565AMZ1_9BRAS|nr:unnamed protein product [Arabis nemorensis]
MFVNLDLSLYLKLHFARSLFISPIGSDPISGDFSSALRNLFTFALKLFTSLLQLLNLQVPTNGANVLRLLTRRCLSSKLLRDFGNQNLRRISGGSFRRLNTGCWQSCQSPW